MKLEDLLRTHDFTKGLAQSQICLATLVTEVHFDEEQLLLFGGGLSEYLYLLISGSVAVELTTPQLTLTAQVLGPGQARLVRCSGGPALLFSGPARESVFALRIRALAQRGRADGHLASELMLRTLRLAADQVKATAARFAETCVRREFGPD